MKAAIGVDVTRRIGGFKKTSKGITLRKDLCGSFQLIRINTKVYNQYFT